MDNTAKPTAAVPIATVLETAFSVACSAFASNTS